MKHSIELVSLIFDNAETQSVYLKGEGDSMEYNVNESPLSIEEFATEHQLHSLSLDTIGGKFCALASETIEHPGANIIMEYEDGSRLWVYVLEKPIQDRKLPMYSTFFEDNIHMDIPLLYDGCGWKVMSAKKEPLWTYEKIAALKDNKS